MAGDDEDARPGPVAVDRGRAARLPHLRKARPASAREPCPSRSARTAAACSISASGSAGITASPGRAWATTTSRLRPASPEEDEQVKPVLYLVRALPGGDLSPLRGLFEIRGGAPRPPPRERLVEEARDAAVLVPTYIDRVDAALVDALPALRHVASYGVGVNHLDLDACRRRGVLVTNTPGRPHRRDRRPRDGAPPRRRAPRRRGATGLSAPAGGQRSTRPGCSGRR